ncbi:hypothetical protein AeMF1_019267 [Aphanomyces euteiches]|nr:hypothetical protein AeMF1_019267 [Aphanomyces euteiches]
MAERQTLQNRLLRSEVEKEEVAKELEQTRSNLALSVNRIRIMEDDGQNFRQRLSDLNAEKEGCLLRSLTALQHQGRDLQIRAQDQHRDEMTRMRVDHQFDLERIRKEAEDENAQLRAAHLEEIEQIRVASETQISKIRAESKSASVESGSEVTRLAEVNQRLLDDLARLELQHKDWETERRELQHLDDQEAAYAELEDELRIVKSQHEQDFRQAYEDYQKQPQSTKESGSGRQQEILVAEINRLSDLVNSHKNQAHEQVAKIEHLEMSIQTKSRLIYELEASLMRRVSPRGQPGLPCQICPTIQRELLEARSRIRTMTDRHADEISTQVADLESMEIR